VQGKHISEMFGDW